MNLGVTNVHKPVAEGEDNGRRYRVERFGREGEPVIVIDAFSGRIAELEAAARRARYSPVVGYPGLRSLLDPNYLRLGGPLLARLFAEHLGFEGNFGVESCAFSIVAARPADLTPMQRRPHYDGTRPDLVATVHYTGEEGSGGTAFYRHRRTGFETVRPERADEYEAAVKADEAAFGPLPGEYYYGDTDRYEMIGEVEAAPDRLVAYRGWNLHSGVVPTPPPSDPDGLRKSGRVTINAFLIGQR
ncbi:hypothetical protein F7D01_01015 [Erythrobacter sp. 3-20A1M]|uniref:DUF6445 family protein n=1 Tax=Erythrobacter sp. 3-20A1M TaxID=2653850 RepID=UPI001BFCC428|nr:DUF6445 family protein [Erythrobacter sp. 3-20A1M]QWC55855.1 hypothetical protein F7D01_01015 [Erythrobacter sp. 3-20A1M]